MVKRKKVLTVICIIIAFLLVLTAGTGMFIYKNRNNSDVVNVFDEMITKRYAAMEEAEHVAAGGYDAIRMLWDIKEGTPLKIGIVYSMEYKKLYIYGDADMPEEIRDMSYQEYFEESLKEYGITWEEVEDRKEDFICKSILAQWFAGNKSRYTKDRLGELEVLDFLMPYEYCGKDNSEWMTVTETVEEGYEGAFQGKVQYTAWNTEDFLCRQMQKSRDYGYHDIMERIEADMNGFNTVSEEIRVEWYCKADRENENKKKDKDKKKYIPLKEIFCRNLGEFADWLRAGGNVEGNLTKLSYTREEGEAKTREMIKKYTEGEFFVFLETADYYITGDELNIRAAYYDCEAENPDWMENGKGELWQGWITVKLDDIREFLVGYDFYVEREKDWKVVFKDEFGYLYKDYNYYDYLEEHYHVLEYSITTVPRDDYNGTVLHQYLKEDIELDEAMRNEHPGGQKLEIDYHLFDFNDDGMEDYLVCMHESDWSQFDKNLVRIYVQEKDGVLRCVFEGGIHLHDSYALYDHVPIAALEEKSGGCYILALPAGEILLKYDEESGQYKYQKY